MIYLALNATEIGRQRGGNESHLLGLLEGLRPYASKEVRLTLIVTKAGAKNDLIARGPWEIVNVGTYRRIPFHLWQQTRLLRRIQPDWYISTYFLPPILPCRGAVIVHDLSFLARPGDYPHVMALYMRILTGQAVRQAERVLVVSEFTRSEVEHFYPFAATKTRLILNGVSQIFAAASDANDLAVLAEYGISQPYLLAIGNIHPRKNLARLLNAYLRLRGEGLLLPRMVWVGMPRWESEELISQATKAGVLLTGYVPQTHLPALYRQAQAFIYPSLYEGFGLPVVEAMACGTPVICSNTTSIPEVAGGAALLVNPESTEEVARALRALCEDPAQCLRLRELGLKRASGFTWAGTARRLLAALCDNEAHAGQ